MKHNVFRFGHIYYRQKDGTAKGAPLATDWATQMFIFYEMTTLQDLFGKHLRLNRRFVDDKIDLWKVIPNGETYSEYKNHLNKVCKLNWEASSLSNQVMFLDLIICIGRKSQKLKYKPYAKNENLFICMSH